MGTRRRRGTPGETELVIDDAIASIDQLCEELLVGRAGDPPVASVVAAVTEVRDRLAEPLRVAIGGRLKAGKSTLVNVLVGERIAQTDVGECTQVITWFRFGETERIEIAGRTGHPSSDRSPDAGSPRRWAFPSSGWRASPSGPGSRRCAT